MLTLTAQGETPKHSWVHPLPEGSSFSLGRESACDLSVPWDRQISRLHANIRVANTAIVVERNEQATNPIFADGTSSGELRLGAGESFVIGSTTFTVNGDLEVSPSPGDHPIEQFKFDRRDLTRVRFRDADKRIDVLTNLPEVIRGARVESDLYIRLANLILAGVQSADAVAVLTLDKRRSADVHHFERRHETAGDFKPSTRLVVEAISSGETILHIWHSEPTATNDYTETAEFDWAFCTPVTQASGQELGLYVAGRLDATFSPNERLAQTKAALQGDVKFTEFVAQIISSVQRQNQLERQQAGLRQFFAPPILAKMGDDLNTDLLEPRECEATVLFCDLRGFSQRAEESADDLLGLLDRVSRALEVMTREILHFGGVTGDFLGDAALAFWGWPFSSEEAPLKACQAALAIRKAFDEISERKEHPLANFRMGIGVAHGRAVAGKIGTSDQVKFTVFGPVVNLASRLEGMTKLLRVPILIDEATATAYRNHAQPTEGRIRKLARLQPYGMEIPLTVSELLPTHADMEELSDELLTQFEEGVDSFIAGDWERAWQCLHAMPANDRAQDFLSMHITQHNRSAPNDWDGVIRLREK